MRENGNSSFAAPYPLLACLQGQRVLVVGGGSVAARKVRGFLEHGASVRVVSPRLQPELRVLADAGSIEWERRPYREGDLDGFLLAVGCAGKPDVDAAIAKEGRAKGTLVNIVDVPELCTFIVPSVLRRGRLQIAVSTSGAAPALARGIREKLEADYPLWWEDYLDMMAQLRLMVKARVPGPASVRTPLHEAVAASGLEGRYAAGERPSAEEVFAQVVQPMLEEVDA
jgi:precorrin-2 dehydrogenase/sirohydrochlorin ferrochelatase